MRPLRKVPVVMMVARPWMMRPSRSLRPVTWRGATRVRAAGLGSSVGDDDIDDLGLLDEEVGDGFEFFAHADAVEGLIALGAGRPDGGATGGVEQAELDAAGVGDLAHDAAEGVDLAHEMAFGDAADGGVAGHLGDEVEVEREQGGAEAHAGGGGGGLATGVPCADDQHVELL